MVMVRCYRAVISVSLDNARPLGCNSIISEIFRPSRFSRGLLPSRCFPVLLRPSAATPADIAPLSRPTEQRRAGVFISADLSPSRRLSRQSSSAAGGVIADAAAIRIYLNISPALCHAARDINTDQRINFYP